MDREAPFTERFRIRVEAGWSGFAEALPPILDTARRGDTDDWGPHLFFDDGGALVGNGGGRALRAMAWRSWATLTRPAALGCDLFEK